MRRVVVTGVGVVSALGTGVEKKLGSCYQWTVGNWQDHTV